jgi:hypothetical protein
LMKGDGTGEPVDLASIFPTVGDNWWGSNLAMPMFRAFDSWSVCGIWRTRWWSDRD